MQENNKHVCLSKWESGKNPQKVQRCEVMLPELCGWVY